MIYNTLKRIFVILFFLILFSFYKPVVSAQSVEDSFDVSADVSYQVLDDTKTRVTQDITITNKKEFVYTPSYSISIHLQNMSDISVKNDKGSIPFTVSNGEGDTKKINITFPDRVVGVGKENNFIFSFTSSDFAKKNGSILTVSIPSLSGAGGFNSYKVRITVPKQFTNPSIIKPDVSFQKSGNTYIFSNNNEIDSGIEIVFGESQVYEFNLSYHLENKNTFPIKTEIALPPNTSYQEVLLESLVPKPTSVATDQDGNILATYTIPSKTTMNVEAEVLVKVSKTPKSEELSESDRKLYLKPQKYWEVNDPQIKKLASSLKTPEAIYNYVVKTLSYDDRKADSNNSRLGAKNVLAKPYFAVCLEFTDLFVALSRASGIPARALEGYANNNDTTGRPVSLFQDVLHAWPEYYDDSKKAWVMVDPTWGNTTEGIDYFKTLDFDHVVFAINGSQSTYPVPAGGYKTDKETKDVVVSFPDSAKFVKTKGETVSSTYSSFSNGDNIEGSLILTNNGNSELASYPVFVSVDGQHAATVSFPKAPASGSSKVSISIPLHRKNIFSLTNINHTVTIQDEEGRILDRQNVRVFPFSQYLIIGGAIFVGFIFILILAFKTRSVSL